MMRTITITLFMAFLWAESAYPIPETVSVRVTDVTTTSFALVWMTDIAATPAVEVYSDSNMINRLNDSITMIPMPDVPQDIASVARNRGIMKLRITGLTPNTSYYVRAVTADPASPSNIGYSSLQHVTTAAAVVPYKPTADGTLYGFANDLAAMKVYIRPSDPDAVPGLGDLILLETPASYYPVSAFVGAGISAPEGVVDLNNLFGADMTSLVIQGGEKALLSIYRGGTLSTLHHYRRLPVNSSTLNVGEPVRGFFADINLDGKVDEQDFTEFRRQYRSIPDDPVYNPDYKFVEDQTGKIDAKDFARFAKEYGRVDVQ